MNAPDLPNEPPASQKARTEADTPDEIDTLVRDIMQVPYSKHKAKQALTRLLAKRELEVQSALITNIYNLANDIANKDPDMHGSEYLRHYHYTSALDREQKRLRQELAKYGQDAVKPERRQ